MTDPSGQILYTRAGNFGVNANGQIVMSSASDGRLLEPAITIPQDTVGIVVSPEGLVSVQQAGTPQLQQVGTNSVGAVRQSARSAEAGRKSVSGNRFLRPAVARKPRHGGLWDRSGRTRWKIRT